MASLIINGKIKRVEPDETIETAILIDKGRILQIADPDRINLKIYDRTEIIDAKGAVILPGFIDAHNHFTMMGTQRSELDLSGIRNREDIIEKIRQENAKLDPQMPIIGFNYEFDFIHQDHRLCAADLEAVAPDRMIQISDRGGHLSVTTPSTLKKAGILLNSREYADCIFPCGGNFGGFTGEICGVANSLLSDYLRIQFRDDQTLKRAWKQASNIATEHGVTSIHALVVEEEFEKLIQFQNQLPIKLKIYTETKNCKAVKTAGLKQVGGCGRVMVDGDTGPYTAAFLEPYRNRPNTKGLLYYSDEELEDYIWNAHTAGLQVALHCIGDAASEQFLNAIENAQQRNPRPIRHRIEHFEFGTSEQITRAKKMGVAISLQPTFNHYWPHTTYFSDLGEERAMRSDPIRSVIDRGVPVGFGSDCPVTPCDPLLTIYSAVNHSLPHERISPNQAIRCHTLGGAYLGNEETEIGSITVGKAADLVFLAADPAQVNPDEIKDIPVLKTIINGETVYSAD